MTKKKPAKKAADPARQTIYANIPRDLAQRIRAEAERLGYPHSQSSVITQTLLERFPAPAEATTEGSS